MVHTYTLNEDQYYNDALIAVVRLAIEALKPMGNTSLVVMFSINDGGPSYNLLEATNQKAYTYEQMVKWMHDGDLCDAIEVYHNVYKSTYGCRPRFDDTRWTDLDWLRAETKKLNEEPCYE